MTLRYAVTLPAGVSRGSTCRLEARCDRAGRRARQGSKARNAVAPIVLTCSRSETPRTSPPARFTSRGIPRPRTCSMTKRSLRSGTPRSSVDSADQVVLEGSIPTWSWTERAVLDRGTSAGGPGLPGSRPRPGRRDIRLGGRSAHHPNLRRRCRRARSRCRRASVRRCRRPDARQDRRWPDDPTVVDHCPSGSDEEVEGAESRSRAVAA